MIEAIALVVAAIDAGWGISSEAVREQQNRKKGKAESSLSAALNNLDFSGQLSDLALAAMMGPTIKRTQVDLILSSPRVANFIRSLVTCRIALGPTQEYTEAAELLRNEIEHELASSASRTDAVSFARQFIESLTSATDLCLTKLTEISPQLAESLRQTTSLKHIASVLNGFTRQQAALKQNLAEEFLQQKTSFLERYRRACEVRHGQITPPDFDTKHQVPIRDLYVAPNIVFGKRTRATHYSAARQKTIAVTEFIASINRTVILGDPGGGKSTLSNYIISELARPDSGIVPVHVTLRKIDTGPRADTIVTQFEDALKFTYQLDPIAGLFENLLELGECLVVFDGLDELINPADRGEMAKAVEQFSERYPHTRILVTSRQVGYDQARLDPDRFELYAIGEFTPVQVLEYATKWFAYEGDPEAAPFVAQNFFDQSDAVPDLRTNPLMLALMCIIFRGENYIPRNRPDLYERCTKLLFEKWDGHRSIKVPLQTSGHIAPAMQYIAHEFLQAGASDSGLLESTLVDLLSKYLLDRAMETSNSARRAAEEFVEFCRGRAWVLSEAGLDETGHPLYKFTHRTFMEYFAAVHIVHTSDSPEKIARVLLPRVARNEWDVVAQLAVQQAHSKSDLGSDRVLRAMLEEKRKRALEGRTLVTRFIARCTGFAVISPQLVRDVTNRCLDFAFDTPENGADGWQYVAPFFDLIDSADSKHRETITSQMLDVIESRILDGRIPLQSTIIPIALAFGDLTPDRIELSDEWLIGPLVALIRKHSGRLESDLEPEFQLYPWLSWTGIVSSSMWVPTELASTSEELMSQFQRVSGVFPLPVGRIFPYFLSVPWELIQPSVQANLTTYSAWLAASVQRVYKLGPTPIKARTLGHWILDGFDVVVDELALPQVVIDACVLCSLILTEGPLVVSYARDEPFKERSDFAEFAKSDGNGFSFVTERASDWVRSMVDPWLLGEVTVLFSNK